MSYVCDENSVPYYEGIYNALGECIHKDDPAKMVSFVFGWCSIGCWIVAQIPQVVKSIILKNVESVSVLLFINWFIGDLTNLLGCLFTGGLVTQIASGVYYMFIDTLCVTVNLYFRRCYKPKNKKDRDVDGSDRSDKDTSSGEYSLSSYDEERPILKGKKKNYSSSTEDNNNNNNNNSDNKGNLDVVVENKGPGIAVNNIGIGLAILTFLKIGMAGGLDEEDINYKNFNSSSLYHSLIDEILDDEDEDYEEETASEEKTPLYIAGCVLGYVSCIMYLAARLPQIIKNAKQHNVSGLAPAMFALAAAANTFYALSIVLGSKTTDDFIRQIPWLIGSAGTLMFDATLLGQYFHYQKKAKQNIASEISKEEEEKKETKTSPSSA